MMKIVLAVAALAVLALAQENPCCVPQQWTGLRGGLGAQVFTLQPELVGISEITYYDYTYNRLRLDINVSSLSGREDRRATEIYRWDLRKQYVIENGVCTTNNLAGNMDAFGVPNYATKRGEATLGASLTTSSWSWREGTTGYELIVTNDYCVPVVQAAADVEIITERAVADLWLNVTVGADPTVFNPPPNCRATNNTVTFSLLEHIKADLKQRVIGRKTPVV